MGYFWFFRFQSSYKFKVESKVLYIFLLKSDHRERKTTKSYKSASTSKTSKTTGGKEQISKIPKVFGIDILDLNINYNRQQYYFNSAPIYDYSQNVYFEGEKNQVTDRQKMTKVILLSNCKQWQTW